ncbi:MAG: hypothetical protein RBR38_05305 [Desulfomicrobium apsheronum]|nr:hypothetical protein [Desulfomicrobium apsheronum]
MIYSKNCARCAGAAIMTAVLRFWAASGPVGAVEFEHGHGISFIFKYHGKDFVPGFSPASGFDGLKNKERGVMNFIARYVSDEMRSFFSGGGYDLEYIDYDWSLNEQEVAP